ncbi:hypothetical protein [Streptomyces sp. NPDC054961]
MVKVVGQDCGITIWFRTYYEDEDLWLYFDADDEGWAARRVEVQAQDSRPSGDGGLLGRGAALA